MEQHNRKDVVQEKTHSVTQETKGQLFVPC